MDHKRKCIALANEIGAVVFYCNTCTVQCTTTTVHTIEVVFCSCSESNALKA